MLIGGEAGRLDDAVVLIGFDDAAGSVTAASGWGGRTHPMKPYSHISGTWGEVMSGVGPDRSPLHIRRAPAELDEVRGGDATDAEPSPGLPQALIPRLIEQIPRAIS